MNKKGQKVEEKKVESKINLSMPEIVLKVITAVLERIETLIFYFPPRPRCWHQHFNIFFGYLNIRYPGASISDLPIHAQFIDEEIY